MKKLITIAIVVGLIGVLSVGAYAHYSGDNNRRSGGRMMYGHSDQRQGRGSGSRWNTTPDSCDCGKQGNWSTNRPGWKGGGRSRATQEMITEEKAKEAAEAFVAKYLSGYTIEKVEKDNWRPMYIVTLKGENDAELQMLIHGSDGQVMHLFPLQQPAE
jgi:uncharacterized membrane protein YkoI